jgi:hypothetical protein
MAISSASVTVVNRVSIHTGITTDIQGCTWCAIGFLLHIVALTNYGAQDSTYISRFG